MIAASALAAAVIIYPTWTEVYTRDDGAFARIDHGRHFLWQKPAKIEDKPSQGVTVLRSERSATLVGIAIATMILYFLLKRRDSSRPEQDTEEVES